MNNINVPVLESYRNANTFYRRFSDTYIEQHFNQLTNTTRGWNYYNLLYSMDSSTYCISLTPCSNLANAETFTIPKYFVGDNTINTKYVAAVYIDAEPGAFTFNLCITGFSTSKNEISTDNPEVESALNAAVSTAEMALAECEEDNAAVNTMLTKMTTVNTELEEIIG